MRGIYFFGIWLNFEFENYLIDHFRSFRDNDNTASANERRWRSSSTCSPRAVSLRGRAQAPPGASRRLRAARARALRPGVQAQRRVEQTRRTAREVAARQRAANDRHAEANQRQGRLQRQPLRHARRTNHRRCSTAGGERAASRGRQPRLPQADHDLRGAERQGERRDQGAEDAAGERSERAGRVRQGL